MKKTVFILLLLTILGSVSSVFAEKKENKVVCFKSSMDCTGCEKTISDYVKFEKGVKNIEIDHISNTVKITYTDGKNSDENLAKAIIKKGYKAEKITEEEYNKLVETAKKK